MFNMSAAPNLEPIFRVIEGGLEVAKNASTEVIADNGAKIVDIFTHETIAGNGSVAEVAEIVNISEGASVGTTEGVALLSQPIQGVAVPAIAVGLGTVAGVALGDALWNLSPQFWTDLSNSLVEAGVTVKGKLVAFMDNLGKTTYPQTAIEIIKNALLGAGIFDTTEPKPTFDPEHDQLNGFTIDSTNFGKSELSNYINTLIQTAESKGMKAIQLSPLVSDLCDNALQRFGRLDNLALFGGFGTTSSAITIITPSMHFTPTYGRYNFSNHIFSNFTNTKCEMYRNTGFNGFSIWVHDNNDTGMSTTAGAGSYIYSRIDALYEILYDDNTRFGTSQITGMFDAVAKQNSVADGATIPTGDPFPVTYPSWQPASKPTAPVTYPVSQPTPDGTQPQAQTGLNPDPAQQGVLSDYFYVFDPVPAPEIDPDPSPQPQPEPEPIPEPEPTPETDPIDPNPEPEESENTPVIPPVATTPSSALFTVYNPTDGELDNLGAFLWSSSIIDQLKKIWQNPLDGIIALHKVYAAPTTGGTQNIILGYVDSEVSASVVTSQFVTVDCGSVAVPENKQNATDYSPFTQLQIYLPFVGIQELDTNEIMNGSVNVKYKIDLYTGTCIAMIFVTRSPDKENAQLLYTFSGNCSQQIPLTASNFNGAIASLLGIVGVGVASGGALGAVAGMGAIAHSLTHEMVHIQHSGGLSANSGILAPRKPFLIISRQYGYDANNYNQIYGFPANKTVYLSNCKDFVRVKAVNYKGRGTETEKQMIVDALKGGVLI